MWEGEGREAFPYPDYALSPEYSGRIEIKFLQYVIKISSRFYHIITCHLECRSIQYRVLFHSIPRSLLRVGPRNPQINTPLLAAGMVYYPASGTRDGRPAGGKRLF